MEPHPGPDRRPFPLTPDPSAFRPTPAQAIAGAALDRAFREGAAAALSDGEPGTGKTLVGLRFLDALPPETPRAMIAVPRQAKPAEVLQAVLFDLGRPYQGLTEHELRLAVTAELLTAAEANRRFVLSVDEAHNLTADAVEELRLLGNVGSPRGPALFVLLVGRPGIRAVVAANPSFAHRVAARCRLDRLTANESLNFLAEEVRAFGSWSGLLFADKALRLIGELAGGVPRVLNRLAGLAYTLAEADGADWVDVEAVLAAAEELDLSPPEPEPTDSPPTAVGEAEPVASADQPETLPHPNQVPRPNRPLTPRHLGGTKAKRQPTAA